MVDVIKDNRSWDVKLILGNIHCPYLYYPANYHGCRIRHTFGENNDGCTLEDCPRIYIRQEE